MSFSFFIILIFNLLICVAVILFPAGCKKKKDPKPSPVSASLPTDKDLPIDPRFTDLFADITVVDLSKEVNFKKCSYKKYSLNEETKNFSDTPDPNPSVDSFEYDALGRKIRQLYEYGLASQRSVAIIDWNYDSANRLVKTTSGSRGQDGGTIVGKNCVVTYDGDSDRMTNISCYLSPSAEEDKKQSVVDFSYDLGAKKRVIVSKNKNFEDPDGVFRMEEKMTETHLDTNFSFPLLSTVEKFVFDPVSKSEKLMQSTNTEVKFADGRFASVVQTSFDYENSTAKKAKEISCSYSSKILNCTVSKFNKNDEAFQSGEIEIIPYFLKLRPSDLLECPSPSSPLCGISFYARNRVILLGELALYKKTFLKAVEGKEDGNGDQPSKRDETLNTFLTPIELWMLENPASSIALEVSAEGKFSESKSTVTESSNGNVLTLIEQVRKNNGSASSQDGLGEVENLAKSQTECERP